MRTCQKQGKIVRKSKQSTKFKCWDKISISDPKKINKGEKNMNENTVREEQKRVDSEIRIYEDYAKQYNREHLKLDAEERRDLKQEEMRERRKAQVETMVVNAEGLPIVFTQNVRVGRKDRICANIMYPNGYLLLTGWCNRTT